jgi:precorrin-6B methylase 2
MSNELSPTLFFNTVNAYQRTGVIKAAVELEVFTAISEGMDTATSLAARCATSERGMRILCDYLTVHGFLAKSEGRYSLTPDSAMFLVKSSPEYLGSILQFMLSPMLEEGFKDVASAVRQGGTVIPQGGSLAPEHPMWVKFARSMAPMMAMPAQLLAQMLDLDASKPLKVLDIAAGHGLFGIAIAQHHPHAQIVAVDWPNVLEVAQENAEKAGMSDRYSLLPGSAFEVDCGTGYDLVMLVNILHHFDLTTCEQLLKKIHPSLAEGGKVVTLEFIPNEDRISPPDPAAFSMVMLISTSSGDSYTFPELKQMFSNAGFSSSELHPLPPTLEQVVISQK